VTISTLFRIKEPNIIKVLTVYAMSQTILNNNEKIRNLCRLFWPSFCES